MRSLLISVYILLIFIAFIQCSEKKAVNISPTNPKRGQEVVITYDCSAPNAKIPDSVENISIKFSYSTLYNQPYELPLRQIGNKWEARFELPHYAVYATFFFKSGDIIDQPATDRHYELIVYNRNKPIENAFLYKAYSLSAQIGKSDSLEYFQKKLYEEELKHYPDNYEAKVRLLNYHIKHSSDEEQKEYRTQAHKLIKDKLLSDPYNMGNVNKVTMGYLILGEKDRVDSTYQFVLDNYPDGTAAKELYPSSISKETPLSIRIEMLEKALENEPNSEDSIYRSIHQELFNAFLELGNGEEAIIHAEKLSRIKNPYTPQTRLQLAESLVDKNLQLEYALTLTKVVLDSIANYPVGIIRYFPEYGYILPYVDNEKRTIEIKKAKARTLSLMSLIYAKQGNYQKSQEISSNAMQIDAIENESLNKLGLAYELQNNIPQAISAYRKILVGDPSDTLALENIKQVYIKQHQSGNGLDTMIANINKEWRGNMLLKLNREKLDKHIPDFTGIVDMKGNPIPAELTKNKVVFISFWATWCLPCMKEMPYLQKVYEKYKNNPNVQFLIINSGVQNTLNDAKNWSAKSKYTFPIYYNENPDIGKILDFNVIPANFVIDTEGKLQFKAIGFEGPSLESRIDMQIELLLQAALLH